MGRTGSLNETFNTSAPRTFYWEETSFKYVCNWERVRRRYIRDVEAQFAARGDSTWARSVWFCGAEPFQMLIHPPLSHSCHVYELLLGPRFFPKVATTFTKRRLYWIRLFARPVFAFFFSFFSTLGVCPFTFPAREREPWTLPGGRDEGRIKWSQVLRNSCSKLTVF